jgi:hypothetical protein
MKRWDGHYGIISPFVKRIGPDLRIHQGWCSVFLHEACSCGDDGWDDGRGGRRRGPRGDDGGTKIKTPAKRKREFA